MAGMREIRERIASVSEIMKITNAMYLISSSNLKKAKKRLENTEPYFEKLQSTIHHILLHTPEFEHKYFDQREEKKPEDKMIGYIVVTADKGLAGAYNHNVLKLASEQLEKGGQNKLFVVGELGRQYFMKKDVNIDGEFSYTVQNPTLYRARHIGLQLIDEYVREELDEVYIIYTKMINAFKMEADMFQLLPLQREEYTHKNLKGYSDRMTFHPSVESVLNSLIPNVVCGFVYGALVGY